RRALFPRFGQSFHVARVDSDGGAGARHTILGLAATRCGERERGEPFPGVAYGLRIGPLEEPPALDLDSPGGCSIGRPSWRDRLESLERLGGGRPPLPLTIVVEDEDDDALLGLARPPDRIGGGVEAQ